MSDGPVLDAATLAELRRLARSRPEVGAPVGREGVGDQDFGAVGTGAA